MIKYEVNQPFPFPNPAPGSEVTLSEINTAFFDVKAYLHDAAPDEIRDWRKGALRYGLFEKDKIPFFIIAFEAWDLDVSINILKVSSESDRTEWLNKEGNIINLYLIDAATNVLKAMRMISIPLAMSEAIRDILEEQLNVYESAQHTDRRIAEIQQSLTTKNMMSKITMRKL